MLFEVKNSGKGHFANVTCELVSTGSEVPVNYVKVNSDLIWERNTFELEFTVQDTTPIVVNILGADVTIEVKGSGVIADTFTPNGFEDYTPTTGTTYVLRSNVNLISFSFATGVIKTLEVIKMSSIRNLSNFCRNQTELTDFIWSAPSNLIEDFSGAFSGCIKLPEFPANIDTSRITNFSRAWSGCVKLGTAGIPFPLLDTSTGIDFSYAWQGCVGIVAAEFPFIDVSGGKYFNYTWEGCINITNFPVFAFNDNALSLKGTFKGCTGITNISVNSIANVIDISEMYMNCTSIDYGLDSLRLQVNACTTANSTFEGCTGMTGQACGINGTKLKYLRRAYANCVNFTNWHETTVNMSACVDATEMLLNCSNCGSIFNARTKDQFVTLEAADGMFEGCSKLSWVANNRQPTNLPVLKTMSRMFKDCILFPKIEDLYIPEVTDMSEAFSGCGLFNSFPPFEMPTTCTTVAGTWRGCTGLVGFPFINFSYVKIFDETFQNCTGITSFTNDFYTSRGISFQRMFQNCTSLTCISRISTTNAGAVGVGTKTDMFNNCSAPLTNPNGANQTNLTDNDGAYFDAGGVC